MIDWTSFTPLSSFFGGCMIGLAAFLLRLGLGRTMGVSGILAIFFESTERKIWQVFFLLGVVIGPLLFLICYDFNLKIISISSGVIFYFAALIIGLGTAIGSGCTSGHGICGLAQFSGRSFVAVLIFMTAGILTVYLSSPVSGINV